MTATFAGTCSGMTSGTGLANAQTIASSAISSNHAGSMTPGPLNPTSASAPFSASATPPVGAWPLPFVANHHFAHELSLANTVSWRFPRGPHR